MKLLFWLAIAIFSEAVSAGRPMTVRDCIEKTEFDKPLAGPIARFSPDGRYFYLTTHRGVLETGERQATIWLFDVAAVNAAIASSSAQTHFAPRALAVIAAVSNEAPISHVRWSPDGRTIVFLGRGKRSQLRLFAVNPDNARLRQLSPEDRDVIGFEFAGQAIVYRSAGLLSEAGMYWQSAGPGFPDVEVGTGRSLFTLLYPQSAAEAVLGITPSCMKQRVDCPRRLVEVWRVRNGKSVLIKAAEPTDVRGERSAADAASAGSPAIPALTVALRESVNEPPVLIASSGAGPAKEIWNPNPQFADIDFGQATVYQWRDPSGNEWKGGLIKPPGYVAERRYPLLLQTHGFDPTSFLTDGYAPTANAARPIAGRGIVVLQVDEIENGRVMKEGRLMPQPQEAARMREGYVAAIRQLDAEGLIDPHNVGIIGFSITGWYVLDALLHAGEHFKAATLAETTYVSFNEYTLNADRWGNARHLSEAIGARPFGAGLQLWLERSAGFNTDKIGAPVLYQANSPEALFYLWDLYALMRLQQKPVELLYIRGGDHVLSQPLQRLASQEMNVDWFDFWLNGHEDPAPMKAAQYARWRELRSLGTK